MKFSMQGVRKTTSGDRIASVPYARLKGDLVELVLGVVRVAQSMLESSLTQVSYAPMTLFFNPSRIA